LTSALEAEVVGKKSSVFEIGLLLRNKIK
jgi:hypothetical protein